MGPKDGLDVFEYIETACPYHKSNPRSSTSQLSHYTQQAVPLSCVISLQQSCHPNVAVKWVVFARFRIQISVRRPATARLFMVFINPFKKKTRKNLKKLHHDSFLPVPFEFVCHDHIIIQRDIILYNESSLNRPQCGVRDDED